MFEIYLFKDQATKSGDAGHVRFVAAEDEPSARHKVAYGWGHWWRTCGIREVTMDHWQLVFSNLKPGVALKEAKEAYADYYGQSNPWNRVPSK